METDNQRESQIRRTCERKRKSGTQGKNRDKRKTTETGNIGDRDRQAVAKSIEVLSEFRVLDSIQVLDIF